MREEASAYGGNPDDPDSDGDSDFDPDPDSDSDLDEEKRQPSDAAYGLPPVAEP